MKYVALAIMMLTQPFLSNAMNQENNFDSSIYNDNDDDTCYNENPAIISDIERLFDSPPLPDSSLFDSEPTLPNTNRGIKEFISAIRPKNNQQETSWAPTVSTMNTKLADDIRTINSKIGMLISSSHSTASLQQQNLILNELKSLTQWASTVNHNVLLLHEQDPKKSIQQLSVQQQETKAALDQLIQTIKVYTKSLEAITKRSEHTSVNTLNCFDAIKKIELQSNEHGKAISTCNVSLLTCAQTHQNKLDEIKKMLQVQRCNQRCEMVGISSIVAIVAFAAYIASTYSTF